MVVPPDWAERHRSRRSAGIPTVSVLLGSPSAARAAAAASKQSFVWLDATSPDPEGWVHAWDVAQAPTVSERARSACAGALGIAPRDFDTLHGDLARSAIEACFSGAARSAALALARPNPGPATLTRLGGLLALLDGPPAPASRSSRDRSTRSRRTS